MRTVKCNGNVTVKSAVHKLCCPSLFQLCIHLFSLRFSSVKTESFCVVPVCSATFFSMTQALRPAYCSLAGDANPSNSPTPPTKGSQPSREWPPSAPQPAACGEAASSPTCLPSALNRHPRACPGAARGECPATGHAVRWGSFWEGLCRGC